MTVNPVKPTRIQIKKDGVVVGERNAPVDFAVFGKAYQGANSVEDVIANVEKETGVKMTVLNVRMKAAGLRKAGVHIPNLPSVSSGKRGRARSAEDIAALNAMFAPQDPAADTSATA